MGNIFSEKVRCSCGNLAVYRCKINLQDYKEREKFYYNHPEMEAYWRRTYFASGKGDICSDEGKIEESFISCSTCMKEKHAPLFTHCPGGWVEEEYEHPGYEEMGVLLST
nr:hypothetical protein Cbor_532 [Cedratvirus borely]